MGGIIFQSRRDHKELDTPHHILEPGMADNLASYRPGDSVEIYYQVSDEIIKLFESGNGSGLRCYTSPINDPLKTHRFQVVIGFTIVRLKHALMKELKHAFVFTEIMHSIVVEPDTDVGEEALVWILKNLKPDWYMEMEAQEKEQGHDSPTE